MILRFSRVAVAATALSLLGAGCLSDVPSPQAAQPLVTNEVESGTPRSNGFGALPTIQIPASRGAVALGAALPPIPTNVTIIRPKRGTPNDTQFRNLANALGISDGFIGNTPTVKELGMDWADSSGFHWTYKGTARVLEFANEAAPSEPLTVRALPSSIALLETGNAFLVARGVPVSAYGQPTLDPDWNRWWADAQAANKCMDRAMLLNMRVIASSASLMVGQPPVLPVSSSVSCVSPEFPARVTIRYRLNVDGRNVVRPDGAYVPGIELVIDASRMSVVSGRIVLPATDPDRSDYPALTSAQVSDRLTNGGSGGTAEMISITSFEFASLQLTDPKNGETYLVPALVGYDTGSNRVVVPLLAQ